MIATPTVLIIGAGASVGYGFPLGIDLVKLIVAAAGQGSPQRRELLSAEFRGGDLDTFSERLRLAGARSIDTFLEGNASTMVEIGKAAIALIILQKEDQCKREGRLFIGSAERLKDHWLEFVWDQMRTGSAAETFVNNQITFITFNYDRLIEYYFRTVLQNAFALPAQEAENLTRSLRIIHLHGQLGTPIFGHYRDPLPGLLVQEAAKGIRVIHDQFADTDSNFQAAHGALEGASRVCMLGFGYHPVNIERLRLAKYLARKDVDVQGSAYNMGLAEVQAAHARLGRTFAVQPNYQAEQFLREMVQLT
jgi:hypothetical protein